MEDAKKLAAEAEAAREARAKVWKNKHIPSTRQYLSEISEK